MRSFFSSTVDNTLLDKTRVSRRSQETPDTGLGAERQQRYWALYEELRAQAWLCGLSSVLCSVTGSKNPRDP
jgi:hypothetical protein